MSEDYLSPVVPLLFTVSLDLHRMIQFLDHRPADARVTLRAAISRLDETIAVVRRAAFTVLMADRADFPEQAAEALVDLADALTTEPGPVSFLRTVCNRAVDLTGCPTTAIILLDADTTPYVAACAGDHAAVTELCRQPDGPWLDTYHTDEVSQAADPVAAYDRWPQFTAVAHRAGFRSVRTAPVRVGWRTVGVLVLLGTGTEPTHPASRVVQGLADFAAMGLMLRADEPQHAGHLQTVLHDRMLLEQAKGIVSARLGVSIPRAHAVIVAHARHHVIHPAEVARAVVERDLDLSAPNE